MRNNTKGGTNARVSAYRDHRLYERKFVILDHGGGEPRATNAFDLNEGQPGYGSMIGEDVWIDFIRVEWDE